MTNFYIFLTSTNYTFSLVIAFEEKLNYEWITGGMKKLITSGEGALYKFSGRGKLWIQTKDEIEYKKD